jgi:N-succinyldiaminopimelate aminotransferase
LLRAVTAVKQFLTFAANGALQLAVAGALIEEDAWVAELRAGLQRRRDQLVAGLREVGFGVYAPAGTYFVQADVRPLGGTDAAQLARRLPADAGVVAIPTSVFYDDPGLARPYLRFAFCKREEVLDEALTRLMAARRAGLLGDAPNAGAAPR